MLDKVCAFTAQTGYNIQRLSGDETEEDYARLVGTDVAMES